MTNETNLKITNSILIDWNNESFIKPSENRIRRIKENNQIWTLVNNVNVNWTNFNRGLVTIDLNNITGFDNLNYPTYCFDNASKKYYFMYANKTKDKDKTVVTFELIPDIWVNEIVNRTITGTKNLTSNRDEINEHLTKFNYSLPRNKKTWLRSNILTTNDGYSNQNYTLQTVSLDFYQIREDIIAKALQQWENQTNNANTGTITFTVLATKIKQDVQINQNKYGKFRNWLNKNAYRIFCQKWTNPLNQQVSYFDSRVIGEYDTRQLYTRWQSINYYHNNFYNNGFNYVREKITNYRPNNENWSEQYDNWEIENYNTTKYNTLPSDGHSFYPDLDFKVRIDISTFGVEIDVYTSSREIIEVGGSFGINGPGQLKRNQYIAAGWLKQMFKDGVTKYSHTKFANDEGKRVVQWACEALFKPDGTNQIGDFLKSANTVYWLNDNTASDEWFIHPYRQVKQAPNKHFGLMVDEEGQVAWVTDQWKESALVTFTTVIVTKTYTCDWDKKYTLLLRDGTELNLDYGWNYLEMITELSSSNVRSTKVTLKSNFKQITKLVTSPSENFENPGNTIETQNLLLQQQNINANFNAQQNIFKLQNEKALIDTIFNSIMQSINTISTASVYAAQASHYRGIWLRNIVTGGFGTNAELNLASNALTYEYDKKIREENFNITKNNYELNAKLITGKLFLQNITNNSFSTWQLLLEKGNRTSETILAIVQEETFSVNDLENVNYLIENVGYPVKLENKSITLGVNKFTWFYQWPSVFQSEINQTLTNPFKVT